MRKIFIMSLIVATLNGAVMPEGEFIKEKGELAQLKKDLDAFYKLKESEYKKQKKELEDLNNQIKSKMDKVEEIKKENQKILDEIDKKVTDKATVLYDKMKPKVAASILSEMAQSGNINDVFDIMIKLKDKKVVELLKLLDTKTSTQLMSMIKNYKSKQETEGKK
jgi:flagellar motility protein MotE (MotC chaperone)